MHAPLDMLASNIATRTPNASFGHFQDTIPAASRKNSVIGALLVWTNNSAIQGRGRQFNNSIALDYN